MSFFLGRFHPVFVHLPIGVLMVALLIYALSFSKRYSALAVAVPFLLIIGMISAIASVITGLFLSSGGEYDEQAVNIHMWMGIAVAAISVILVFLTQKYRSPLFKILSALLFAGVIVTGHLGGNITHGEGYLLAGLSDPVTTKVIREPIADIAQAVAYKDVIHPILEEKCFGCHGAAKQKGKLRMDEFEFLIKGGKNGKIIVAGDPAKSEMIKRIELPTDDDHHMAPKEKSQVSENEIALLKWWIETGASPIKKVGELPQDEKIKPRLMSLQSAPSETVAKDQIGIPREPVEQGDADAIRTLQQSGMVVIPVARDQNYLQVAFFKDSILFEKNLPLLVKLKSQVVSLKCNSVGLSEKSVQEISRMKQLIFLNLSNCGITDKGVTELRRLDKLQSINLVGNPVSGKGVSALKDLTSLKFLYLYNTRVSGEEWKLLNTTFSEAKIDSGGYQIPYLEADTVIEKVKPIMK